MEDVLLIKGAISVLVALSLVGALFLLILFFYHFVRLKYFKTTGLKNRIFININNIWYVLILYAFFMILVSNATLLGLKGFTSENLLMKNLEWYSLTISVFIGIIFLLIRNPFNSEFLETTVSLPNILDKSAAEIDLADIRKTFSNFILGVVLASVLGLWILQTTVKIGVVDISVLSETLLKYSLFFAFIDIMFGIRNAKIEYISPKFPESK